MVYASVVLPKRSRLRDTGCTVPVCGSYCLRLIDLASSSHSNLLPVQHRDTPQPMQIHVKMERSL